MFGEYGIEALLISHIVASEDNSPFVGTEFLGKFTMLLMTELHEITKVNCAFGTNGFCLYFGTRSHGM